MKATDPSAVDELLDLPRQHPDDPFGALANRPTLGTDLVSPPNGAVVGELVALMDDGRTPLVTYPGQSGTAAVACRSVIDLHGVHVGSQVVLIFEVGNNGKPIILGVLRREVEPLPVGAGSTHVEVHADGEHFIVTARNQLVLRCGKASITLTRAGKVLIEGAYVSSRSSGVNRVKGGSVQIN